MYTCFSVWGYVHMSADSLRDKRHWIPLEPELQAVYKLPNMAVGKRTQVLFESSMYS